MADLKIIETGNGGDVKLLGRDLAVLQGFGNMPYLAMFGGNVEASTPRTRATNEQAFDFWGNSLFHPNETARQFNSLTERRLNEVALNSAGRIQIEQAVQRDLEFMKPFAQVTVTVTITGPDRVQIAITLIEPDNTEEKQFIYIWDGTRLDLADGNIATPPAVTVQRINHGDLYTDYMNSLLFDYPYTSTAYTPIIIDRGGADIDTKNLTKLTDRVNINAPVQGALITWVVFPDAPNAGYRTGQTTLTAGLNTIPFVSFGTMDYTIIAMDKDKVGVDFSTLVPAMGSFNVSVPVAGGKLFWVAVKNNYFDNIRPDGWIPVAAGGVTIPYSSPIGSDVHTLMLMDLYYGPGNIINVTQTSAGFYIEVGFDTLINYLAINE